MIDRLEKSLEAKLIFWVFLSLILVFGFTTWFDTAYLTNPAKEEIKKSADLTTYTMMEVLKSLMLSGNQDLVQRAVSTIGKDIIDLSVVDSKGMVKKSSNQALMGKKFQVPGFNIQEALKGKAQELLHKNDKGKIRGF